MTVDEETVTRGSPSERDEEITRLRNALDRSIKNWHKTELELARTKDALTQILRMPTVGAHAKAIAREALAQSSGIRET